MSRLGLFLLGLWALGLCACGDVHVNAAPDASTPTPDASTTDTFQTCVFDDPASTFDDCEQAP